jgi:hypothetical protein
MWEKTHYVPLVHRVRMAIIMKLTGQALVAHYVILGTWKAEIWYPEDEVSRPTLQESLGDPTSKITHNVD